VISKIVNSDGETIYEKKPEGVQVADPAIFAAARRALEVVPISGTAPRANLQPLLGYKVPQGGKTGTHQSYLDAWFVGFTAQYSTAVWVGFEAQQVPLTNVVINGQSYSRVFGGSVPAPIWAEFMAYVQKDLPVTQFPPDPDNINKYLIPPPTTVPSVVGLDRETAEQRLTEAKLNATVEEIASLEPVGTVVNQSVEAGSTVRQGSFVTIWVSTGETPVGTLPNMAGLTFEEALDVVRDFELETGVRITLVQQTAPTSDQGLIGKIISTNPPAGTELEATAQVVAMVGAAPAPTTTTTTP
ncbi:MAG: PASTA domain-containing protein, partial [Acidimicrobiia bacterium]